MADNEQRRSYTPVFTSCWLAPHLVLQMNPQMALSIFELIQNAEQQSQEEGQQFPSHLFKFRKSLEQFLLEQGMLQSSRREIPAGKFA